jgi:signal transduction histidine kinase
MDERPFSSSDALLAVALVAIVVFGTGPAAENQHQEASALAYALAVAACLPVAFWRWRPAAAGIAISAATLAYLALGYAYGPVFVPFALGLFGLAAWSTPRVAVVATSVILAASLLAPVPGLLAGTGDGRDFAVLAAWVIVPVSVGALLRTRRQASADIRHQQALRVVSEERVRLAQEVHDVVGHELAVIAMHAGVALRVFDHEPARVRESLAAIRAASTGALDGLRAQLAVLRDPAAAPELRPAAGLADVPALLDRIRASGLPVRADVDGFDAVPEAVGAAAYRILQESLTNVLRHGGPGVAARVRVAYGDGTLRVAVADTGRRPPGPEGQGIAGMRARAESLGGTLTAGPGPDGGFTVRADLPVREGADA